MDKIIKILSIFSKSNKKRTELNFWCREIDNYLKWFKSEVPQHFGTTSPKENEKIMVVNEKISAILCWKKLHQEKKYLIDLGLEKSTFAGQKVLDLGSGPIPSAEVFEDCEIYSLDPLMNLYLEIGFPFHLYKGSKFIQACSEDIPIPDAYFDTVISVNAIDHVDNLLKTSQEMKRVLKNGGWIRIHAHYHPATTTEPIELNDDIMKEVFAWCKDFRKIKESKTKHGFTVKNSEMYALWSNMEK